MGILKSVVADARSSRAERPSGNKNVKFNGKESQHKRQNSNQFPGPVQGAFDNHKNSNVEHERIVSYKTKYSVLKPHETSSVALRTNDSPFSTTQNMVRKEKSSFSEINSGFKPELPEDNHKYKKNSDITYASSVIENTPPFLPEVTPSSERGRNSFTQKSEMKTGDGGIKNHDEIKNTESYSQPDNREAAAPYIKPDKENIHTDENDSAGPYLDISGAANKTGADAKIEAGEAIEHAPLISELTSQNALNDEPKRADALVSDKAKPVLQTESEQNLSDITDTRRNDIDKYLAKPDDFTGADSEIYNKQDTDEEKLTSHHNSVVESSNLSAANLQAELLNQNEEYEKQYQETNSHMERQVDTLVERSVDHIKDYSSRNTMQQAGGGRKQNVPEQQTSDVRIGQVDVIIEKASTAKPNRNDVNRPSVSMASRYYLRRL